MSQLTQFQISLALDPPSSRGGSRKTGTLPPAFSANILAAPIRSLVSHD